MGQHKENTRRTLEAEAAEYARVEAAKQAKREAQVQAAKENECNTIIRGIRDTSDLNYELRMYNTNRRIDPNIETLFIPTDNDLSHISSSLVRQIYKLGGSIESLVPDNINKYLIKNFNSIT